MQSSGSKLSKWLIRTAFIVNTGLALSYVGLWAMTAWRGQLWRADFSSYYTGWSIVRDGAGQQLYDLDLQTRYQQKILNDRSFSDGLLPFTYPPHMALFFSPLARLPRADAFWVWTLGECALLIWLLRLLYEMTHAWQPVERVLAFTAVLGFPALLDNFLLGAFSLLMLICLWQFTLSLKKSRDVKSGIWLAIALIKPQIIILPGFILVGARRWKGIAAAALAGVLIFVICSLAMGWRIWLNFLKLLSSMNNLYGRLGMEPTSMHNFKGVLTSLLGSGQGALINLLSTVALAACILLTMWIWRGDWAFRDAAYELCMAYTILMGMFFNLYLFPQDSLLFVLPALLYYQYLRLRKIPQRAYVVFITACPAIFLLSELVIGNRLGVRIPALIMAGMLIWMTPALWRERKYGYTEP